MGDGLAAAQSAAASSNAQGTQWRFGSGAVRYFIARDANFDSMRFTAKDRSDRIREISALMDSTNPDLAAFRAHGGKLILREHGLDFAQSPFQGISYYKSVVSVDSFIRFYVSPGLNHVGEGLTSSGAAIPSKVDFLNVLDEWADSNKAPDTLTEIAEGPASASNAVSSRPICRYPLYPHYTGGTPNEASSFSCRKR